MYSADIIVFMSIILVVIALLNDAHNKHFEPQTNEIFNKEMFIVLSFFCLFYTSAILWESGEQKGFLKSSFFFSIIAGSIMQPILADPVLTKRTLAYNLSKNMLTAKILTTPWWMSLLWGIALTQLCYFWLRLNTAQMPFSAKYFIFIFCGSLYFYVFEFIVCNYAYWWTRKNCWQPFGVAMYATIAETITVAILPFFIGITNSKLIIIRGLSAGFVIASIFVFCGYLGYRDSYLRLALRK